MTVHRRRPEADHERGVVAPLYGGCGITVVATSARNHVVGITPGTADLICQATRWGFTFYHETKVEKTKQSKEQYDFMLAAHASGTPYVLGDVTSAMAFLCWLGIATRLNDTIRFYDRAVWRARVLARSGNNIALLAYNWSISVEHVAQRDRWGWSPRVGPLRTYKKRG